jgi:hypothetical protein
MHQHCTRIAREVGGVQAIFSLQYATFGVRIATRNLDDLQHCVGSSGRKHDAQAQ